MDNLSGVGGVSKVQGLQETGKGSAVESLQVTPKEINPNGKITHSNASAGQALVAMNKITNGDITTINRDGIQNLFNGLQKFNAYCDFATKGPSNARIAKEVFYNQAG